MSIQSVEYQKVRARCGECIHEGRSLAQADLYVVSWEGKPALLKDFSGRPAWVRRTWARMVLAREVRVLRALQGVPGVPELWATAGPLAYVMERLEADRLPRSKEEPLDPEFWPRLRKSIEAMHARGIAHGDLRRKNIMVGPQGEAYLIDFATAVREKPGQWLSGFLFRRCRQIDRVTYARLKKYYQGGREALNKDELQWLDQTPWYLKVGRILKKKVYRWRKPKNWRKLFTGKL